MRPIVWNLLLLLVASILLAPGSLHGQDLGVLLGEYLLDPLSARSAAMTGAVSSLPGDYTAMMYNPATLGFSSHLDASLTYCRRAYSEDYASQGLSFGIIYPTVTQGSFGGSFLYFLDPEFFRMDPFGTPTGTVRPYTMVASISHGRRLTTGLAVGATAKFVRNADIPRYYESTNLVPGNTWALDASLHYKFPIPMFNTAISVLNLGPEIHYSGTSFVTPLPTAFRAGISVGPIESGPFGALFGFDFSRVFTQNQAVSGHWGTELTVMKIVSLRGGYLWDDRNFRGGPTYGGGLDIQNILSLEFASVSKIYEYGGISKNHFSANLRLPILQPPKPENR